MEKPALPSTKCPNCFPQYAYCPVCGEKKSEKEELSFRAFLRHIFEEITEFDSKIFRTLFYLMFRPGYLSIEFSEGRVVHYLRPVRLFITIALVNLLVFSLIPSADLYSARHIAEMDFLHLLDKIRHIEAIVPHLQTFGDDAANEKIRDVLSVAFYGIVFVIAGIFYLLFHRARKYYVEHLIFTLHLVCASFMRNMLLIPVLIWFRPAGFVFIVISAFVYNTLAIARYYKKPFGIAFFSMIPVGFALFTALYSVMMIAMVLAGWQ